MKKKIFIAFLIILTITSIFLNRSLGVSIGVSSKYSFVLDFIFYLVPSLFCLFDGLTEDLSRRKVLLDSTGAIIPFVILVFQWAGLKNVEKVGVNLAIPHPDLWNYGLALSCFVSALCITAGMNDNKKMPNNPPSDK